MKRKIKREIIILVLSVLAFVFVSGFVLYLLEKGGNENIESYWDGVWLAAVSASTIGYGDVYPVSAAGKALSSLLGFAGLLLTGAAGALFASYISGVRRLKKE